ncbi:uncharacterized protein CCOS01_12391 [Colletotrichum costaricense]|uniref:Glycosyl transferase family 8 protein n=1 Tax=Colletotrichum costaricense TaxID=1209916 RepID=A0AAI9YMR2_9PEZI|nr:uncharacterized protein CCOS01_12391 [Colletotrichum costaricense]KAK1516842.1 hypothetical protein CCOS01_12391 [Colletotrichum costaricense]
MLSMPAPRMLSMTGSRSSRNVPIIYVLLAICLLLFFVQTEFGYTVIEKVADAKPPKINSLTSTPTPKPKYKPQPTWTPSPVKDPFPLLSSGMPPPVPSWNRPEKPNVYHKYSLTTAPPLMIGFTRSWPMLLQTVVGYITAGWPAEQIYVVENTGVHDSNARGRLSLQNPFYLNYTQLHMLGVHVMRTPVLLNFAQLQNFFITVAKEKPWSYYFWSHMDAFVLSSEEGIPGVSGAVGTPEYQTIYELAVKELNETMRSDHKWGARFFAYDHLALVNPRAYEDVGGFDTFIPYYMTDCDMHWRLEEAGWSIKEAQAGIVQDVASVLDDLRVLYREGEVPEGFGFTDPNPPQSKVLGEVPLEDDKRSLPVPDAVPELDETGAPVDDAADGVEEDSTTAVDPLTSFRRLHRISQDMFNHKHADRERNTWQLGQRGGDPREPYSYDALGFQIGIDVMTEAGRETFRRKWGHRGCDFGAAGLRPSDAWKVEKDWE